MCRTNDADLPGLILDTGEYTHLMLPTTYNPRGARRLRTKPITLTPEEAAIARVMSRLWAGPYHMPVRAIAAVWGMTHVMAMRLIRLHRDGTAVA